MYNIQSMFCQFVVIKFKTYSRLQSNIKILRNELNVTSDICNHIYSDLFENYIPSP